MKGKDVMFNKLKSLLIAVRKKFHTSSTNSNIQGTTPTTATATTTATHKGIFHNVIAFCVRRTTLIAVTLVIGFASGYITCKIMSNEDGLISMLFDSDSTITGLTEEISGLHDLIDAKNADIERKHDELALKDGIIKEKEALLHKYQWHDMQQAEIKKIRLVKASCFAEVTEELSIAEETPLCFISESWQISKAKFTSYHEECEVKYYLMSLADKINIVEDEDRISITYDANSFLQIPPYKIISRRTYENGVAKVLNNYDNDKIDLVIENKGLELLSKAEDSFIESLKKDYESESEFKIFVNGTPLSEWGPANKVVITNT